MVTALSVAVKWLGINRANISGLVHQTLVGIGRHGLEED